MTKNDEEINSWQPAPANYASSEEHLDVRHLGKQHDSKNGSNFTRLTHGLCCYSRSLVWSQMWTESGTR
jgi:hypothetical protein